MVMTRFWRSLFVLLMISVMLNNVTVFAKSVTNWQIEPNTMQHVRQFNRSYVHSRYHPKIKLMVKNVKRYQDVQPLLTQLQKKQPSHQLTIVSFIHQQNVWVKLVVGKNMQSVITPAITNDMLNQTINLWREVKIQPNRRFNLVLIDLMDQFNGIFQHQYNHVRISQHQQWVLESSAVMMSTILLLTLDMISQTAFWRFVHRLLQGRIIMHRQDRNQNDQKR